MQQNGHYVAENIRGAGQRRWGSFRVCDDTPRMCWVRTALLRVAGLSGVILENSLQIQRSETARAGGTFWLMDQLNGQTDCSKKVKNLGPLVIARSALTMLVGLGQTQAPRFGEMRTFMRATCILLLFLAPWGRSTGIGLLCSSAKTLVTRKSSRCGSWKFHRLGDVSATSNQAMELP